LYFHNLYLNFIIYRYFSEAFAMRRSYFWRL